MLKRILNLKDCLNEKGIISFDTTNFDEYVYSVYIEYEDTDDNYITQVIFMFNPK